MRGVPEANPRSNGRPDCAREPTVVSEWLQNLSFDPPEKRPLALLSSP